jgi:hydrogenase maturation protein HypF
MAAWMIGWYGSRESWLRFARAPMPGQYPPEIPMNPESAAVLRVRIRVRGVVQGVGYRPFVYRLAQEENLAGWVTNDSEGVVAEVEGSAIRVEQFVARIRSERPPLARVDSVDCEAIESSGAARFSIHASHQGGDARTGIPADAASCPDCLRELLDPADRRYGYAFLNCTNCGPRFTITRSVPYDRPQTSMASFRMCPDCQREYDDPADRRFHAQPNACSVCGPRLEFADLQGRVFDDPLEETILRLARGEIVAVKGIGGFHLAVDATNEAAVQRLRQRKHRMGKPFAVMVKDLAAAGRLCVIREGERGLLCGTERPVVLMRRIPGTALASGVAPGIPWVGIFLPYAPLQHLLFADGRLTALVMTSANLSDEPICVDNGEARERLSGIADGFLFHDREILQRCDDSVMAVVEAAPQVVRRARGYVPLPIHLPFEAPPLLAVGGQMKGVFTLARGREAFQSQHLGDLENRQALEFFESALKHLQNTFEIEPQVVVHDLHPEYLSTQWAQEFATAHRLPVIAVQHHHAHIGSCMAEHGVTEKVIGIALDGTGFGVDGTVWGGEVLVADLVDFARVGRLRAVAMLGGGKAVEQPWRMALSAVATLVGEEAVGGLGFPEREAGLLLQWMRRGKVGPLTSSCGRLFDAVAALVLGRHVVDYEAQAAIELEGVAVEGDCGSYPVEIAGGQGGWVVEPGSMLLRLLEERRQGVEAGILSARFHAWMAGSFAETARRVRAAARMETVCLSGGSMHNRLLTRLLRHNLEAMGFRVLLQSKVSPGDGGLSYGQAAVAAARIRAGKSV